MGEIQTPQEMLRRLISFNTISALSNKDMIQFIADYLAGHGINSSTGGNEDGTKADLIATIGPNVEGGLVLSGHTDVVPVEGQDWHTDPFEMVEMGGRLYGRGTSDMKGFIAVALALVPEILALPLVKPLHFVFSYDEEVGCLGAPGLIARLMRDKPKPRAAIIGEPTSMKLVNAHKGITAFETRVIGKPGHSSQPHKGVNAIAVAADCIRFLQDRAGSFEAGEGPRDERFEPAHTTVSIGTIIGGTANNIIAGECAFTWDVRAVVPEEGQRLRAALDAHCHDVLLPPLRRISPEADIISKKFADVPPLVPSDDNPAEALVRQLTGQNHAGAAAFGTEAGQFQEAGIPSVICGPGSVDQAHQPNEFVDQSQLTECADFIRKLAGWAAAN